MMTFRLELPPDVEANLAARAQRRGVTLDVYLQTLIEEFGRSEHPSATNEHDISRMLDALAEMGWDLPDLPLSAFGRESIYKLSFT